MTWQAAVAAPFWRRWVNGIFNRGHFFQQVIFDLEIFGACRDRRTYVGQVLPPASRSTKFDFDFKLALE